jgi:hypothetical protein
MPGDELSLTLRSVREVGRLALTGTLLSVLIPSMDRDLTSRYVTRLYFLAEDPSNNLHTLRRPDGMTCACAFFYLCVPIWIQRDDVASGLEDLVCMTIVKTIDHKRDGDGDLLSSCSHLSLSPTRHTLRIFSIASLKSSIGSLSPSPNLSLSAAFVQWITIRLYVVIFGTPSSETWRIKCRDCPSATG